MSACGSVMTQLARYRKFENKTNSLKYNQNAQKVKLEAEFPSGSKKGWELKIRKGHF